MNRRQWTIVAIVFVAALISILGFRWWATRELKSRMIQYAQDLLDASEFKQAETQAASALTRWPDSVAAALIAGEAAVRQERLDQAIVYLESVLDTSGNPDVVLAMCAAADLHLQQGHAQQAEELFRRALDVEPDQPFASTRLIHLLTVQGRRWESQAGRFDQIRRDQFTVNDLLFLGNSQALVNSPELKRFRQVEPDNALHLLGEARLILRRNEVRQAEQLLRRVTTEFPDQLEAQAALGVALFEQSADRPLVEWQRQLPPEADRHPDIWMVRGMWARKHNQIDAAIRCFWEAVRLDPNHHIANYQLSACLAAAGDTTNASVFKNRANQIEQFVAVIDKLFGSPDDLRSMRKAAELAESMGRLWESWGWYRAIAVGDPQANWAVAARDRIKAELAPDVPQVMPTHDLASTYDFSARPLPNFDIQGLVDRSPLGVAAGNRNIRFQDRSGSAGIDFAYFNGDDPQTEGRRMFEFTGGGIGIIDFDQDDWPDLYLTQGTQWPPRVGETEYRDRLFRNLGNGQFADVTLEAGLGDNRFSQGVAIGDYDNDGFPDIFVGNVGENRLYHNNGDGTFTDRAVTAGVSGPRWTTSCLIADVNGDSIPDLYEVNYLQGNNVYDLICNRGGHARSCSPVEFDAQQDRFFAGLGDGRFADQTEAAGLMVPNGKGLGIVAVDHDGSGRLSLFVANDTTANSNFVPLAEPKLPARFEDRGLLMGLAYDRDGKAQACMGIAVDDVDGDHQFDLFVTNFYRESNTLYHQREGGYFVDDSREWGLKDSSFSLLGFGTQFLDADLDGRPDLVVTNGHIDDFSHEGAPYQMPPKVYHNVGGGFAELPPETLGPYFARKLLGRGLARVDWNRDGREDFVVSHLDAPLALMENQTAEAGNFLVIQFRGRTSSRDAIGVTVVATIGETRIIKQLTAGDGYLASNERRVTIGLGASTSVDELSIRWPSGVTQSFSKVDANQFVTALEHDPTLHAR